MMEANPEKAELTGYFRMGGEVDVLGIISVSIELYLSLKYEFNTKLEYICEANSTVGSVFSVISSLCTMLKPLALMASRY